MTASTTLQLKISRTRKRLSSSPWNVPIILIASVGVMILLSSLLRAVTLAGRYGLVEVEIPVAAVPLDDSTFRQIQEPEMAKLEVKTPLVFLGRDAFIFGTTEAFTSEITNVRNKFYIPHEEGSPNLPALVSNMERWARDTQNHKSALNTEVVILMPQEDIPFPIVIQTIESLKQSGLFGKVVLGGGLL